MFKANIEQWASRNGYKWEPIGNQTGGQFTQTGIVIHTDYMGSYPPLEVYQEHNKIKEYARRAGCKYKPASMHTGAYLYFREVE